MVPSWVLLVHTLMFAQANVKPNEIAAAQVSFVCNDSPACGAHRAAPPILDPVRFTCYYCTFAAFVVAAFHLHAVSQIVGVPPPLRYRRYSLEMAVDKPVSKSTMMSLMWDVVAQAFHVRWHVDEKAFPALALVVRKHTLRFRRLPPGVPPLPPRRDFGAGVIHFQTIAQLVDYLNAYRNRDGLARRQIIDQTGLVGRYKIDLKYRRPADAYPIPLLALVKEQLGLGFAPTKQKAHVLYVVINAAQVLRSRWTWQ